jgi:hypothetical protein
MPKAEKKYRPYFTLQELKVLHKLAEDGTYKQVPETGKLSKYLESFIYEITKGYRSPAHITNPRASIEERLGIGEETAGPTIAEIQAEEAKLFGGES